MTVIPAYTARMPDPQTSMNVSLPTSLREWVERRVEEEGYSSSSEYIRELMRADRKRWAKEEVDRRLQEALDGPSKEMTEDEWEWIHEEARRRVEARRAATDDT